MPNKKSSTPGKSVKKKGKLIDLRIYGILDTKNDKVMKISLDQAEIHAEIALMGGLPQNFAECEFRVKLGI
jgi:hypothetical protein